MFWYFHTFLKCHFWFHISFDIFGLNGPSRQSSPKDGDGYSVAISVCLFPSLPHTFTHMSGRTSQSCYSAIERVRACVRDPGLGTCRNSGCFQSARVRLIPTSCLDHGLRIQHKNFTAKKRRRLTRDDHYVCIFRLWRHLAYYCSKVD